MGCADAWTVRLVPDRTSYRVRVPSEPLIVQTKPSPTSTSKAPPPIGIALPTRRKLCASTRMSSPGCLGPAPGGAREIQTEPRPTAAPWRIPPAGAYP